MKITTLPAALVLSAGLLTLSSYQVQGNANVYWNFDDGFAPSTVVISPGESVVWWNYDLYGFDVTITIGSSLSFTLQPYKGQGVTFPNAGTYSMQSNWGDAGSVIVSVRPLVTITNPVANAVFTAPATVTVGARATDADGIYSVQFYVDSSSGSEMIAEEFTAPYSATNILLAGSYTLRAVATDNYGLLNSDSINITVNSAPTIDLVNPRLAGHQFLFDVTGLTVGKTNVVLYGTNLATEFWTATATNTATTTSRTVTNALAAGPRFYRLYQQP